MLLRFFRIIKMLLVGLTGGIATGKSTTLALLREVLGERLVSFDCDACVGRLLKDREVLAELAATLGSWVLTAGGDLDRSELRERTFRDVGTRRILEGVLHPLVRKECLAGIERAKHLQTARVFLADVPLLYEGGFDFGQDQVWVVACSPATQVERLRARSGFAPELIARILSSQWPIERKLARADRVLWNEGPSSCLRAQILRLTESLIPE